MSFRDIPSASQSFTLEKFAGPAPSSLFGLWARRHRSRKQLMETDDDILHEVGITRYDAMIEAQKPFWQA